MTYGYVPKVKTYRYVVYVVASKKTVETFLKGGRNVLGPFLREIRLEAGISQKDLVARLQVSGWDITRQILNFVEKGSRQITDVELFALLSALGSRPSDLEPIFRKYRATQKRHK